MSVDKLPAEIKNNINMRCILIDEKDTPEYTHSFDLFIENASETNIAVSELKAEFFTAEEDYPTKPKKVYQRHEKINLNASGKFKIGKIKITSTSRHQFLLVRWTLMTADGPPIQITTNLQDVTKNVPVTDEFNAEGDPLPIIRMF